MGSFDGAEICELVGIYILETLAKRIPKENSGLYRDDGLIILRNLSRRQTDKTRKDIEQIFKEIGFKIDIKTNLKIVDFLDVTFNLNNDTYRPYKKENDKLLYINTSSNHPTQLSSKFQLLSTEGCQIIHLTKKFSNQSKKNTNQH